MATIQGQSTSNASSISQKAAIAALAGDQACVAKMNEAFKERHDFIVDGLELAARRELPARRRHVLRVRGRVAGHGRAWMPRRQRVRRAAAQ